MPFRNQVANQINFLMLKVKMKKILYSLIGLISAGEFNDKTLREQVTMRVSEFLTEQMKDKTVKIKSFRVQCDEHNNPPELIDQSKIAVDVFIDFELAYNPTITHYSVVYPEEVAVIGESNES